MTNQLTDKRIDEALKACRDSRDEDIGCLRFMERSLERKAGWEAALREVQRLRFENAEIFTMVECTGCGRSTRSRYAIAEAKGERLCHGCAGREVKRLRLQAKQAKAMLDDLIAEKEAKP